MPVTRHPQVHANRAEATRGVLTLVVLVVVLTVVVVVVLTAGEEQSALAVTAVLVEAVDLSLVL